VHWRVTQLKRIVRPDRPITYGIVQAGEHVPDGIPYIRPADMTDESGVLTSEALMRTAPDIAMAYRRSTLRPGELVCSIGPSFGKVMVTPSWLDGANLTQGTARVSVAPAHEPRYVFWALRSPAAVAQWESSVGGATFRALNLGPLAETLVAIPGPDEQGSIARFLDRETAGLDALVNEQRRLIELLQEKRRAVISHAVTKGLNPDAPMKPSGIDWLGDVPAHWEIRRLRHVAAEGHGIQMGPFGGMLKQLANGVTGYKLYGQENTIKGDFEAGARWLCQDVFESLKPYELLPGDLVLTRKGASIGNCRIVPDGIQRGIIDSDTIRVRLDTAVIVDEFAALLMHEGYMEASILEQQKGAVLPGLNSKTVAGLVVALPPVQEQQELLAELRATLAAFESLIDQAVRAIALLRERRTALISAAVTGQIDVRGLAPAEATA
jgi:type I restriction enzyme S subunit